jgi:nucleotidyltransferase substrate binding protein (TIGR01987 family)
MNEKKKEALRKFEQALSRLAEAVAAAPSSLQADAVIQRFEFTFELLWKTLKIYLIDLGIETKSPKETLKATFKQGWITDEKLFLDMLEDRNQTSHVYDQSEADIIFNHIRQTYLPALESMRNLLKTQ